MPLATKQSITKFGQGPPGSDWSDFTSECVGQFEGVGCSSDFML
jgi:hypothetical protein